MTLTEAAILTRKVGFWVVSAIVLLILLKVAINISTGAFRHFFPKPTPPPNVAFGRLTPYDFSANSSENTAGVSFALKTIDGKLPNLGNQTKVYKVFESPPSILFGEKARELSQKLKFTSQPQILSDRKYIFTGSSSSKRKLDLDLITQNFKITDDITLYPELFQATGNLNKEDSVRIAKNFLTSLGLFQKDFVQDQTTIQSLKIEGGELVAAKSLAEAQVVRVGFPRANLDKLPILSIDAEKPNVWVEVTSSTDPQKQIFQASYFYYPPDLTKSSTYPVKATIAAFDELTTGKGILIGKKASQLEIRRIFLAYLETVAQMNFLTPVYVFSGDNFTAFVPAIPAEWFGP